MHVLQERNIAINSWSVPDPTLWSDFRHTSSAFHIAYTSKLGAYESMIDRIKFDGLNLQSHCKASRGKHSSAGSGTSTQMASAAGTQAVRGASCSQNSAQQSQQAGGQGQERLRLNIVADFPHVHSSEARQQMCDVLSMLASTASMPTVILVTDSGVLLCVAHPQQHAARNQQAMDSRFIASACFGSISCNSCLEPQAL